jgi:hypothetical protein
MSDREWPVIAGAAPGAASAAFDLHERVKELEEAITRAASTGAIFNTVTIPHELYDAMEARMAQERLSDWPPRNRRETTKLVMRTPSGLIDLVRSEETCPTCHQVRK